MVVCLWVFCCVVFVVLFYFSSVLLLVGLVLLCCMLVAVVECCLLRCSFLRFCGFDGFIAYGLRCGWSRLPMGLCLAGFGWRCVSVCCIVGCGLFLLVLLCLVFVICCCVVLVWWVWSWLVR